MHLVLEMVLLLLVKINGIDWFKRTAGKSISISYVLYQVGFAPNVKGRCHFPQEIDFPKHVLHIILFGSIKGSTNVVLCPTSMS